MFNLEVEMSAEPVVEEGLFNVTSSLELKKEKKDEGPGMNELMHLFKSFFLKLYCRIHVWKKQHNCKQTNSLFTWLSFAQESNGTFQSLTSSKLLNVKVLIHFYSALLIFAEINLLHLYIFYINIVIYLIKWKWQEQNIS